jgi:gamma-glutamyltranspeptidase/glutathione hydrolase
MMPVVVLAATPHCEATAAAERVFADGGNAVDSALVAASVPAVVYPHTAAWTATCSLWSRSPTAPS